jgi:hypothetical protein
MAPAKQYPFSRSGQRIDEWAAKTLTTSSETPFRKTEVQYPELDEASYLWLVQSTAGLW